MSKDDFENSIEFLRNKLSCELSIDGDGYFCIYSYVDWEYAADSEYVTDKLHELLREDIEEIERAGLSARDIGSDNDSYWLSILR